MNKHIYIVQFFDLNRNWITTKELSAVDLRKAPLILGSILLGREVAEYSVQRLKTAP